MVMVNASVISSLINVYYHVSEFFLYLPNYLVKPLLEFHKDFTWRQARMNEFLWTLTLQESVLNRILLENSRMIHQIPTSWRVCIDWQILWEFFQRYYKFFSIFITKQVTGWKRNNQYHLYLFGRCLFQIQQNKEQLPWFKRQRKSDYNRIDEGTIQCLWCQGF